MFLLKNDVNFSYECAIQKGDINSLCKKFENVLLELNEEYLDHIQNEDESILEKFLYK